MIEKNEVTISLAVKRRRSVGFSRCWMSRDGDNLTASRCRHSGGDTTPGLTEICVSGQCDSVGAQILTWRLGIDIGGTFTDFALFDERGGEIRGGEAPHHPPTDPSIAVIEGTAALLRREGVPMVRGRVHCARHHPRHQRGHRTPRREDRHAGDRGVPRHPRHGLRAGATTCSTSGSRGPIRWFRGRLRREIPERVGHDGRVVITPLDPESTRGGGCVTSSETAGIEALAICFLHSYANPVHEEAADELVRAEFPDLHVSRSAEVFGNMREYERWTTATMNAFTQPMFDRYVARLERGLADLGFGGRLFVMTSSGTSIVPETAPALSGEGARIRPRRRGADVRPSRAEARVPRPAVVRHGRHHREGRAGARASPRSGSTTWRSGGSTSSRRGAGFR